jgi:putative transposase
MPNHFHLLLRQEAEGGISSFMKHLTDSYTRYFNTKYNRVGPLYQGAFKAVRIETDEQLLHVSRYIHLNPLVSLLVNEKDFLDYPWSSMQYYRGKDETLNRVTMKPILEHFKSANDYIKFVLDQADYGKALEKIKHMIFE